MASNDWRYEGNDGSDNYVFGSGSSRVRVKKSDVEKKIKGKTYQDTPTLLRVTLTGAAEKRRKANELLGSDDFNVKVR